MLFADAGSAYAQAVVNGLTVGALFALVALGYTMVYGIVELINFAHGDVFMLGTFFGLTVLSALGLTGSGVASGSIGSVFLALALLTVLPPLFCAGLNWGIDRAVYRPLRAAPKLAPLVSAIGVSFLLMNLGQFWSALVSENGQAVQSASKRDFPNLLGRVQKALPADYQDNLLGTDAGLRITLKDAVVLGATLPLMAALTVFVKYTPLGKAMRATAQNPTAARLMGINVDRVIGATFLIGGGLAGFGSTVFALSVNSISYQIGYQNGLYAFTAAVLGGIGNIPGAVLGAVLIGLVKEVGSQFVGEQWTSALVFAILIVILVFRPTGLLGARTREKV